MMYLSASLHGFIHPQHLTLPMTKAQCVSFVVISVFLLFCVGAMVHGLIVPQTPPEIYVQKTSKFGITMQYTKVVLLYLVSKVFGTLLLPWRFSNASAGQRLICKFHMQPMFETYLVDLPVIPERPFCTMPKICSCDQCLYKRLLTEAARILPPDLVCSSSNPADEEGRLLGHEGFVLKTNRSCDVRHSYTYMSQPASQSIYIYITITNYIVQCRHIMNNDTLI